MDESGKNFMMVRNKLTQGDTINFECFFEVFVHNCEYKDCTKVVIDCPIVEDDKIYSFNSGSDIKASNMRLEVPFNDSSSRKENSIKVKALLALQRSFVPRKLHVFQAVFRSFFFLCERYAFALFF